MFALALAVMCSAPPQGEEIGARYEFWAFGKHWTLVVPYRAILNSPAWDGLMGDPPLSERKAIDLADKVKATLDNNADAWKLRSATLIACGEHRWFWLIVYSDPARFRTGPPSGLQLVVLMDGTLVKPTSSQGPDPVSWKGVSRLRSDTALSELQRIADDPKASRDARAEAIFKIFANHLKLGQDSKDVAKVLGEAKWLQTVHIGPIFGGTGGRLFDRQVGRQFHMPLFALDTKRARSWTIALVLNGDRRLDREVDAKSFLQGRKEMTRLEQFALHFPDGRIEVFEPRGIRVIDPKK